MQQVLISSFFGSTINAMNGYQVNYRMPSAAFEDTVNSSLNLRAKYSKNKFLDIQTSFWFIR